MHNRIELIRMQFIKLLMAISLFSNGLLFIFIAASGAFSTKKFWTSLMLRYETFVFGCLSISSPRIRLSLQFPNILLVCANSPSRSLLVRSVTTPNWKVSETRGWEPLRTEKNASSVNILLLLCASTIFPSVFVSSVDSFHAPCHL